MVFDGSSITVTQYQQNEQGEVYGNHIGDFEAWSKEQLIELLSGTFDGLTIIDEKDCSMAIETNRGLLVLTYTNRVNPEDDWLNGLFDGKDLVVIRFGSHDEKEKYGKFMFNYFTWIREELFEDLEKHFGKVTLVSETDTEIRFTYDDGDKQGKLLVTFKRLWDEVQTKKSPNSH